MIVPVVLTIPYGTFQLTAGVGYPPNFAQTPSLSDAPKHQETKFHTNATAPTKLINYLIKLSDRLQMYLTQAIPGYCLDNSWLSGSETLV